VLAVIEVLAVLDIERRSIHVDPMLVHVEAVLKIHQMLEVPLAVRCWRYTRC